MSRETTWQDIQPTAAPMLVTTVETDVVVIGGGIAGMTTAYLLARAGKRVVVLEKGTVQEDSVTASTTAFLTSSLDTSLSDLRFMYGTDETRKILQSHEDAIELVERIIRDEHIHCEFQRTPHYSVALSRRGKRQMKKANRSYSSLGFAAHVVSAKTLPFKNHGSLMLEHQATFHPLRYVYGLRRAFEHYGGCYFENSEALSVDGDRTVTVRTAHGMVTADSVVTATHNPFNQPWWFILKKGTYLSYVYELLVPAGYIPDGMYEDDQNPYHYFRVEKHDGTHDRMIIGGEDHPIEVKLDPERSFNALRKYIEEVLGIRRYTVVRRWTGPILEQTDGLPLIGRYRRTRPNRYVETAFSGNGMTNATIAAVIVSDMIMGRGNQYAELYDPKRLIRPSEVIVKGIDYLGEFLHGALTNLFQSKQPFDKKR